MIKAFRSDNALELNFRDFFAKTGTIHQFSCAYTLRQNLVVERKHRHLLNVARALMFQSNVPLTFWGECILSAACLINRTPMVLLSNSTPFATLFNKDADYNIIKTFGCLAYASTPTNRSKFDPRAQACIFMGFPPGYKLYDITKKNFFSRDVLFLKNCFHFILSKKMTTLIEQFVIPCPLFDC